MLKQHRWEPDSAPSSIIMEFPNAAISVTTCAETRRQKVFDRFDSVISMNMITTVMQLSNRALPEIK